jgi:hypothetical protein
MLLKAAWHDWRKEASRAGVGLATVRRHDYRPWERGEIEA